MKHKPGPWKIREQDLGDEDVFMVPTEIYSSCGFPVISHEGGLAPDREWDIEEIKANARLIVASPELLDMVCRLIDCYRSRSANLTIRESIALADAEDLVTEIEDVSE